MTQCLHGSAQCFAGESRYVQAGMLFSNRDGFDAVFAGFFAVFRWGERGCTGRDELIVTVLTRCLQGSAHQLRSNRF